MLGFCKGQCPCLGWLAAVDCPPPCFFPTTRRLLATSSEDKLVMLWTLKSGRGAAPLGTFGQVAVASVETWVTRATLRSHHLGESPVVSAVVRRHVVEPPLFVLVHACVHTAVYIAGRCFVCGWVLLHLQRCRT